MISVTSPTSARVAVLTDGVTRSLRKMDNRMAAAANIVRKYTERRFEARGMGEWPELSESTVQEKTRHGASDPERQLYDTGALEEAITALDGAGGSLDGPAGFQVVDSGVGGMSRVVFGVDWSSNGWQIPVLLDAGNEEGTLPARPIWPTGSEEEEMKKEIAAVLHGVLL